jgi:hypothetical protein
VVTNLKWEIWWLSRFISNSRFVELLIYNVEYCWARGMDFKYASEDPKHDRQKFHSRTRLTKAMSLAQKLNVIAGAVPQVALNCRV